MHTQVCTRPEEKKEFPRARKSEKNSWLFQINPPPPPHKTSQMDRDPLFEEMWSLRDLVAILISHVGLVKNLSVEKFF